jgi:hypothetical protein
MLSAKTVFEEILDNDEASRLFCSEVGGERAVLAWHGPNHSPGNIFIQPGPATTTEPIRNYSSREAPPRTAKFGSSACTELTAGSSSVPWMRVRRVMRVAVGWRGGREW